MVGKAYGLGRLQVGAAGQDVCFVLGGLVGQHRAQIGRALPPCFEAVGHKQAKGQAHLIVAAAARVQFFAHIAHKLGKACLNIHVHVFKLWLPHKVASLDFFAHAVQTVDQNPGLALADDALAAQHAGMRLRSADILGVKRPVVGLRIRILGHGFLGAFGKAAAPALVGLHGLSVFSKK